MREDTGGTLKRLGGRLAVAAVALTASLALGSQAAAAAPGDVVVMVSGYSTTTPFTTSDPSCAGREGVTWGNADGPAAALKAAGYEVFTAPVEPGPDGPASVSCAGPGQPVPGDDTVIDSFGDVDTNGRALASFLAFLRDEYDVDSLDLVAHSDGGIWSRSAITQDAAYAGLEIRSLNTLGTPYTGAFTADAALALRNAPCSQQKGLIKDACAVLQDLIEAELFDQPNIAVTQLTNDYMGTWNPRQQIGACPVTPIAGTWLDLPLLFEYYTPSDALVGEASALAQSSFDIFEGHPIPAPDIPGLRKGTTFPVVHSPTLSFLTAKNLLNQPEISQQVLATINALTNGEPCNEASGSAVGDAAVDAARQRVPLHSLSSPSSNRRFPAPAPGDYVLLDQGVSVRCGRGSEIPATALPGSDRLQLALPTYCDKTLRVASGEGRRATRRGALSVSESGDGDAVVKVDGDGGVAIRFRGARLRGMQARVREPGGSFAPVEVRRGRASLPAGEGDLELKLAARTRSGKAVGMASLSR